MKNMFRIALIVSLLLAIFLFAAKVKSDPTAPALAIVYVNQNNITPNPDGSENNPFLTLLDAVNAAADNADIYVQSGTYKEYLNIDRPLNIHGSLNEKTTIIGLDEAAYAVHFSASGLIENFYIRSEVEDVDAQPVGIGITIESGKVDVRNCIIENFQVGIEGNSRGGILTFEGNEVRQNTWGISSLRNSNHVIVKNNNLSENRYGLYLSDSNVDVLNNVISGNAYGVHVTTRIEDSLASVASFDENHITNNSVRGLWFDQGTLSLNALVDLGGGPQSGGKNIIGNNGVEDLLNDSHGVVYATNNEWLSEKIVNVQNDGTTITD